MKKSRGASQTVLPSADTAAMLVWAFPPLARSTSTKTISRLTSQLDQGASHGWRRREHCQPLFQTALNSQWSDTPLGGYCLRSCEILFAS
jgi:hypothetical protein